MPYRNIDEGKPIEKRYFQISEVAERFHVAQSAIRFWMKEFHLEVKRGRSYYRLFTQKDIEKLEEINYLLKVEKYTIAGAHQKLEGHD